MAKYIGTIRLTYRGGAHPDSAAELIGPKGAVRVIPTTVDEDVDGLLAKDNVLRAAYDDASANNLDLSREDIEINVVRGTR